MPELPEVETMRRGIAGVAGARIASVAAVRGSYKPIAIEPGLAAFRKRAVGRVIERVGRVGKRVTLELDGGASIVFEPRMTGLVLLADPPNREHLRFRIGLDGGPVPELLYWDRRGLGSVRLLSAIEMAERFGEKLGPDALAMNAELWRERLGASRRAIKVALLDQQAVAGIGNLYASEILHLARIAPQRPCYTLGRPQWRQVAEAVERVLNEAIRYEGSTLSDGTYRNALNQQGGYQHEHRVYDRSGQSCRSCGKAEIVRVVQAQRSSFYCPRCQR